MKLEEKLAALRREKNLTQLEVAEAVHVSRQAVSRWEVGASVPSMENLKCLAGLYGVSLDGLLDDREEERAAGPEISGNVVPAKGGGRALTAALAALSVAVLVLALCVGALLLDRREDVHDLSDLIGEEPAAPESTFSLEPW